MSGCGLRPALPGAGVVSHRSVKGGGENPLGLRGTAVRQTVSQSDSHDSTCSLGDLDKFIALDRPLKF
jgi:hypothetical protein